MTEENQKPTIEERYALAIMAGIPDGLILAAGLQRERAGVLLLRPVLFRAALTMNTRPAYSAYSPAKSLPAGVASGDTGPMPPSSMAALTKASSADIPSVSM